MTNQQPGAAMRAPLVEEDRPLPAIPHAATVPEGAGIGPDLFEDRRETCRQLLEQDHPAEEEPS